MTSSQHPKVPLHHLRPVSRTRCAAQTKVVERVRQRGERDSCMPAFCKHQEVIVVWLLIWSFNNTDSRRYIKTFAADAKKRTPGSQT